VANEALSQLSYSPTKAGDTLSSLPAHADFEKAPETVTKTTLLRPQSLHRVHRSRPPRRKIAGRCGCARQQGGYGDERRRIPRADTEEQLAHQQARAQRAESA